MRPAAGLVALLILSACGGGPSVDPTGAAAPTSSSVPAASSGSTIPSTTVATPPTTTATSDRPVAPDFTLELGEGGTYTLSAGSKPVYLVFWAEW